MNKKMAWILVIFWMVLIFCFSAQVASDSNEMSKGLTVSIKRISSQIQPNNSLSIEDLNHFLRKVAHYSVYLVLGLLLKNAFNYEMLPKFKKNIYPSLIGILYAISDEFHQSFVPNRGPQISDVLIDSIGLITGILIFNLLLRIKIKNKYRNLISNIKDRLQL